MTRFAWRQSRTQSLVVAAALAALAVAAAITGVHLSHLYHSLVAPCIATDNCGLSLDAFTNHYRFLQNSLEFLLRLAPALIGVFWGAPLLARELESGTFRLAWTQTVTRSRWLVTKLAVVGAATVLAAGLLTLMITWWYRALDSLNGSMYPVFDARDITPIGYTFFAFMLGALAGAVIRRTLPAMAATLGVFVFTRIAVGQWLRPHLLPPLHRTASVLTANQFGFMSSNGAQPQLVATAGGPRGSWVLHNQLLDSAGHVVSKAERVAFVQKYCPNIGPPPELHGSEHAVAISKAGSGPGPLQHCQDEAARLYHLTVTYQPASHYWPLQWLELAVYVALGLAAAGLCFWWVTRRVA